MNKLVPENHPALHQIAEEITEEEFKNGFVTKLISGMRKALKEYNVEGYTAVAIAAPQVGIAKRVFIVSDQSTKRDSLPEIIAINPKIIKTSKKTQIVGEGCLSVPERYGAVERHKNVTIRAKDEYGNIYERGAGGLLSQIFQHETDHLDGTLFVDRANKVWHKDEVDHEQLKEAGRSIK